MTLAPIAATLAASPAHLPDVRIDAETTSLAIRARAGSVEAFCALVDLHGRAARRVAAVALGSGADADEAVQDACVAAWQRIGGLEDPAAFRTWLLRITWRKALDRRRSLRGWLRRTAATTVETARRTRGADAAVLSVVELVPDPAQGADAQLLARERNEIVAQLIRSLPSRLRHPFLLAAAGEHRYDEIAALLDIPVGTVKWRVANARRLLRDKLARLGFGPEARHTRPGEP